MRNNRHSEIMYSALHYGGMILGLVERPLSWVCALDSTASLATHWSSLVKLQSTRETEPVLDNASARLRELPVILF